MKEEKKQMIDDRKKVQSLQNFYLICFKQNKTSHYCRIKNERKLNFMNKYTIFRINPFAKILFLLDSNKNSEQVVDKVQIEQLNMFQACRQITQFIQQCTQIEREQGDDCWEGLQRFAKLFGMSLDWVIQQSYNWMGSKNSKPILYEQACFAYKGMIKRTSIVDPSHHYSFLEPLGEGSYSKVFLVRSKATGQLRALKKISKGKGHKADRHLINQFQILRQMDHPNIIKMFEMFEDDLHFYIITEYLEGRDALELLHTQKEISQEVAFSIFYQTLLAINYCHKHNVMHRDLKLENILFNKDTKSLKLLDFGSALKFQQKSPKERRCTGTIYYLAPEMINKFYNYQCDIWSLGIILYVLLSGNAPFLAGSHQVVMEKIINQPLSFNNPIWNQRSENVKKLIASMLEKNFEKRIQISDILKNPWVLSNKEKNKIYKPQKQTITFCLENMQKFAKLKVGEIEQGILIFMINSIVKLGNQFGYMKSFQRLDTKLDGEIDEQEIKNGLVLFLEMPVKTATQLAHELMTSLDLDSSGKITYSQFLTISSDLREVLKSENLQKAFEFIDIDSSNGISVNELRKRLGDHIDQQYYSILTKNFKTNQRGQISFKEFSRVMQELLKRY